MGSILGPGVVQLGSGLQTVTQSFTTDPSTFVAAQVFDLADGCRTVEFSLTMTAHVADTETFGNAAGNIYGSDNGYDVSPVSAAGPWFPLTGVGIDVSTDPISGGWTADGRVAVVRGTSTRWLRIKTAVYAVDSGTVYAGAHHPTVTFQVALKAR